jgi:hypothetical protein
LEVEMKEGGRVGAIKDANAEVVNFFGYGVYDGDQEHPDMGFPNPHITLDSGEVVWGCECWWGPEDKIKAKIGDRKINIVCPDR